MITLNLLSQNLYRAARKRRSRKADPEKYRQHDRTKRERHGDKISARKRVWREENPDKVKVATQRRRDRGRHEEISKGREAQEERRLRRAYGLTIESRAALLQAQEGNCKLCGHTVSFMRAKCARARACVDHCHTTGRVRGVLCSPCNAGLGQLQDSPELLERAAAYLRKAS